MNRNSLYFHKTEVQRNFNKSKKKKKGKKGEKKWGKKSRCKCEI